MMYNDDYSKYITPEIEAQMPANLSYQDKLLWEKNKAREIAAQQKIKDEAVVSAATTENVSENEIITTDTETEAVSSDETDNYMSDIENEALDQTDIDDTESADDTINEIKKPVSSHRASHRKSAKKVLSNKNASKSAAKGYEYIKDVPSDVMNAVRRALPVNNSSKADLLSAFIYIFTNGDCEISENAMKIVEAYNASDSNLAMSKSIDERLSNLERMARRQGEMLQSVELCTCYNTFDRRYGSKEKRVSPKDNEFREQGNLDMLHRLRIQAGDQRKIDDIERGREIYNQTKDKK